MSTPADLAPILDDLRTGLRRRASRRRRARAGAATALSTLLLAGVVVGAAERFTAGPDGAAAGATASAAFFAPDGLYGCAEGLACWPQDVNLSKHRSFQDR